MRAVAYCRVSTNKAEQQDSLESQQTFFTEYAKRNRYNLINIYAEEGKSGTKIKNRTKLLRLLSDANRGLFDIVLIKDVSRLARNTVDFLTSIRTLKSLGISVIFVNYDQTSSESSEFMLTLLSAMAQEESANTSKRIKFGKKMNAEHGRVPNFVYGYDKTPGDYFNLTINQEEAKIVRQIFDLYVNNEIGANKISLMLNAQGATTKRGCSWSQISVSRILTNQIYIGKIINGKESIADFLTGKRVSNSSDDWFVVEQPQLAIIDQSVFDQASRIMSSRKDAFKASGQRNSDKHIFSKLIKCSCCSASFRRQVRSYKNTYIKWVCTGRNANGVNACPNNTVIDEDELIQAITNYFAELLKDKSNVLSQILAEFNRQYKAKDENILSEKELLARITKAEKTKQKYMDMFTADIIDLSELKIKTNELNETLNSLKEELHCIRNNITKSDLLENILHETFKDMQSLLSSDNISNHLLSRVIEKIEVNEQHHIDIYLKLFSDIGLENSVLINNNCS